MEVEQRVILFGVKIETHDDMSVPRVNVTRRDTSTDLTTRCKKPLLLGVSSDQSRRLKVLLKKKKKKKKKRKKKKEIKTLGTLRTPQFKKAFHSTLPNCMYSIPASTLGFFSFWNGFRAF